MNSLIHAIALASVIVTPIGTFAETVQDDMFVKIPIADYEALTNKIQSMWTYANSTEDGRVGLHGKRVSRIVNDSDKTVTLEYSDGYRFVDRMKPSDLAKSPSKLKSASPRRKPAHMSDAQWEFVQKTEMISSGKPRRVNAVFGPGGKVESVTEAK